MVSNESFCIDTLCEQADYEQELTLQRAAHKWELARSKDEVAQLLATAEAGSIPVDEELVRRRYMKEIERIKVWCANVLNFYYQIKNQLVVQVSLFY